MLCLGKKQEDEDGVENEGFFCQMDGLFMSALHNHCSHHGAVVIAACNDRPLNVTAQNASYPPRTQGWKRESSDTQRHRQTFGIGNGLEEFQIDCDTRRCGSCSKMEMELEIICLHRPTNQPKKKKKPQQPTTKEWVMMRAQAGLALLAECERASRDPMQQKTRHWMLWEKRLVLKPFPWIAWCAHCLDYYWLSVM